MHCFVSKDAINAKIDALPYLDGNTNTSGGLYYMNTEIFKTSNGDRPNVDNIAIVITDGQSTWDTHLTGPYAKEARDNGVKVGNQESGHVYLSHNTNCHKSHYTK